MNYIPNAAQGVKHDPEVTDVKDNMKAILADLGKIRKARDDDCKRIDKEKSTSMTMIKDFRKKMDKLLDDMEQHATDQVQQKHKVFENKIKADIQQLDNMITILETKLKLLERNSGDNETQLFINVKKGKKFIRDGKKLSTDSEKCIGLEVMNFCLNNDIEEELQQYDTLGYFCYKVNARVKADLHQCIIFGSCQLEDSTPLITDFGNDKLKRLDKSYKVQDYIDLPGGPWGVCCTAPQEVAVTLLDKMKIQFLSLSGKMTPTKSFSVGVNCRGVAYSNNELFVICEDGLKEGQGHMRVYDKEGKLLRRFQNDPTGQQIFSRAFHIAVSLDGSRIYTADWNKGIVTLDRQGQVISKLTDRQLSSRVGIFVDNKHQIVACGCDYNTVLQLKPDGSNLRVLLKKSDGITKPTSLCCDPKTQKLLITMELSNIIKVYDLT